MELFDRIAFDSAADLRMTERGYLTCTPAVARTGIQLYSGKELGVKDMDVVRVYRPEEEVFKMDAWAGMAHKPLTNDHPPVMVDASNWKQYAIGSSGSEVARDGQLVRVPMVFMDGTAINQIRKGKRELSVGYTCDVKFESGETADGQKYDAIQTNIRPNHIALVKAARGGAQLRVGDADKTNVSVEDYRDALALIADGKVSTDAFDSDDADLALGSYPIGNGGVVFVDGLKAASKAATDDGATLVAKAIGSLLKIIDKRQEEKSGMNDKTMVAVTFDGLTVQMDAQAAAIAQRHMQKLDADFAKLKKEKEEEEEKSKKAAKDSGDKIAELTTLVSTKDAEIVTLKKQVEDAALAPAKLDALVKDRSEVALKGKALIGDALVIDGKTTDDMKKQVVLAQIGDQAKDWNDSQVAASFATLTAGVKTTAGINDMRSILASPAQPTFDAAGSQKKVDDSYAAADKRREDAWKYPNGRPAAH